MGNKKLFCRLWRCSLTANSSSKMAFKRKKGEMPFRFEREAEGADLGRREKTYRSDLIAALAESSDSDREPEDPIRAAIVQRRKRANEEGEKHSKHEEEPQTLRDVEEEDEEGDEEEVEYCQDAHFRSSFAYGETEPCCSGRWSKTRCSRILALDEGNTTRGFIFGSHFQ